MEAAAGCGAGGSSSLGGRPGGLCTFAGGGHVGGGRGGLSDLVAGCFGAATGPADLRAVIGAGSSMTTTTGTAAGGAAADGAAADAAWASASAGAAPAGVAAAEAAEARVAAAESAKAGARGTSPPAAVKILCKLSLTWANSPYVLSRRSSVPPPPSTPANVHTVTQAKPPPQPQSHSVL